MSVPDRLCSRCFCPVPRGLMVDFIEGRVVCGACAIHHAAAQRGLVVGAYRGPDGWWRAGAMPRPPSLGEFTNLDEGRAMVLQVITWHQGAEWVPIDRAVEVLRQALLQEDE